MNQKPPRRPPIHRPTGMMGVLQQGRVRLKHIAVVETDPVLFAAKLDEVTNGLVDEGFSITGMMERGGGLIVSSLKVEPIDNSAVSTPQAVPSTVSYYFCDKELEGVQQRSFPSVSEVVRLMKKHLLEPERFSGMTVVLTFVSTFDPRSDMHLLEKLASEA